MNVFPKISVYHQDFDFWAIMWRGYVRNRNKGGLGKDKVEKWGHWRILSENLNKKTKRKECIIWEPTRYNHWEHGPRSSSPGQNLGFATGCAIFSKLSSLSSSVKRRQIALLPVYQCMRVTWDNAGSTQCRARNTTKIP